MSVLGFNLHLLTQLVSYNLYATHYTEFWGFVFCAYSLVREMSGHKEAT